MVSQGQAGLRHSRPKIGKPLIALMFGGERSRDHMSVLASVRVVAELEDKPAIQSIVVRVNLAHHRSLTVRE